MKVCPHLSQPSVLRRQGRRGVTFGKVEYDIQEGRHSSCCQGFDSRHRDCRRRCVSSKGQSKAITNQAVLNQSDVWLNLRPNIPLRELETRIVPVDKVTVPASASCSLSAAHTIYGEFPLSVRAVLFCRASCCKRTGAQYACNALQWRQSIARPFLSLQKSAYRRKKLCSLFEGFVVTTPLREIAGSQVALPKYAVHTTSLCHYSSSSPVRSCSGSLIFRLLSSSDTPPRIKPNARLNMNSRMKENS